MSNSVSIVRRVKNQFVVFDFKSIEGSVNLLICFKYWYTKIYKFRKCSFPFYLKNFPLFQKCQKRLNKIIKFCEHICVIRLISLFKLSLYFFGKFKKQLFLEFWEGRGKERGERGMFAFLPYHGAKQHFPILLFQSFISSKVWNNKNV